MTKIYKHSFGVTRPRFTLDRQGREILTRNQAEAMIRLGCAVVDLSGHRGKRGPGPQYRKSLRAT